jgi:hypothetical protein
LGARFRLHDDGGAGLVQGPERPTDGRWWTGEAWSEHTTALTNIGASAQTQPLSPANPSTPPGWYADPISGSGKRYWDGSTWTEHTHRGSASLGDSSSHEPPRHVPSRRGKYIVAGALSLVVVVALVVVFVKTSSNSKDGNGSASASSCTSALPPQLASSGSSTSGANWTGFGATVAEWDAYHKVVKNLFPEGDYGPSVQVPGSPPDGGTVPPGYNHGTPEWGVRQSTNGRVSAFDYSMPGCTTEGAAKTDVLKQLPSDATTVLFRTSRDSDGNTCILWNLKSADTAQVLGVAPWDDTAGTIGVQLMTVNNASINDDGLSPLNSDSIDFALVSTVPGVPGDTTCAQAP